MKHTAVLISVSLLAILLLSLHLADDIVYGSDKSAVSNVIVTAILAVWLLGTLALQERRSGYAIVLLGSLSALLVFTVHVNRLGGLSAGTVAASGHGLFVVWTLLALGATSILSAILAVQGLWNLQRAKALRAAPTSETSA
jgi:hypothetical protein